MAKQEVKLVGFWASLFSIRAEWGLRLKNINYIYVEEDIYNKSPLLLQLNPVTKKVPVLVHNQIKPIAESLVILEYLDDIWKEYPLLPQEPYQRATARFWAHFSDTKVLEAAFKIIWSKGEDKEGAVEELTEGLQKLEALLEGQKYFGGGQSIGYLDLALGWIPIWLPIWEEIGSVQVRQPSKFPALSSWAQDFCNHPAVKTKIPPQPQMLAYFVGLSRTFASYFYKE